MNTSNPAKPILWAIALLTLGGVIYAWSTTGDVIVTALLGIVFAMASAAVVGLVVFVIAALRVMFK